MYTNFISFRVLTWGGAFISPVSSSNTGKIIMSRVKLKIISFTLDTSSPKHSNYYTPPTDTAGLECELVSFLMILSDYNQYQFTPCPNTSVLL